MTTSTEASKVRRKLRDWNVGDGRPSDEGGPDGAAGGEAPPGSLQDAPAGEPPLAALGLVPPDTAAPMELAPAPEEAAPEEAAPKEAAPEEATPEEAGSVSAVTPESGQLPGGPDDAGPAMDPRMRRRRLDVERAIGRRRLLAGGSILAAVTVVAAGVGVLHTPLLAARHIRIVGVPGADGARLLAAAGLARGEPLIDVGAGAAADRLQELPWVATATVQRTWPSTVQVAVSRRHAVAQMPTGASLSGPMGEVDSTGRIVARVGHAVAGLPVLLGLGPPPALGEWVSGSAGAGRPIGSAGTHPVAPSTALATANNAVEGALALAAGFASAGVDPGLRTARSRTVAVRVAAGRTISAEVMPGPVTVLFGAPTALAAKLDALVIVLRSQHLAADSVLDLQVPDRPTVTDGAGATLAP